MTFAGVGHDALSVNRSKFKIRGTSGGHWEFSAQPMGVQIPCCVYSQVSAESAVRAEPQRAWAGLAGASSAEGERDRDGEHFWARGYYVSTVGKDEEAIKEYVRKQQAEDKKTEQMKLY